MGIEWGNLQSLPDAEFFTEYGKYMASYEAMSETDKAEENKLGHFYAISQEYQRRNSEKQSREATSLQQEASIPYSTLRLVMNILSIALAVFVAFQSRIVMVTQAILNNGSSGAAGFIVALLMLARGIVGIVMSKKQAGLKACLIMFLIASIMCVSNYKDFGDLRIYGIFCIAVFIIDLISGIKSK